MVRVGIEVRISARRAHKQRCNMPTFSFVSVTLSVSCFDTRDAFVVINAVKLLTYFHKTITYVLSDIRQNTQKSPKSTLYDVSLHADVSTIFKATSSRCCRDVYTGDWRDV